MCLYCVCTIDSRKDFRSLSTSTCNLLRKCLPRVALPISSLDHPVSFDLHTTSDESLTPCHTGDTTDTFSKERRSHSDTDIYSKVVSLSLEDTQSMGKEGVKAEYASDHAISWFVGDTAEGVACPSLNLPTFDKFFQEFSYIEQDAMVHETSLPALPTCPAKQHTFTTSYSASAIDSINESNVSLWQPPHLVVSNYTRSGKSHHGNVLFPHIPPPTEELQYKKTPSTER